MLKKGVFSSFLFVQLFMFVYNFAANAVVPAKSVSPFFHLDSSILSEEQPQAANSFFLLLSIPIYNTLIRVMASKRIFICIRIFTTKHFNSWRWIIMNMVLLRDAIFFRFG